MPPKQGAAATKKAKAQNKPFNPVKVTKEKKVVQPRTNKNAKKRSPDSDDEASVSPGPKNRSRKRKADTQDNDYQDEVKSAKSLRKGKPRDANEEQAQALDMLNRIGETLTNFRGKMDFLQREKDNMTKTIQTLPKQDQMNGMYRENQRLEESNTELVAKLNQAYEDIGRLESELHEKWDPHWQPRDDIEIQGQLEELDNLIQNWIKANAAPSYCAIDFGAVAFVKIERSWTDILQFKRDQSNNFFPEALRHESIDKTAPSILLRAKMWSFLGEEVFSNPFLTWEQITRDSTKSNAAVTGTLDLFREMRKSYFERPEKVHKLRRDMLRMIDPNFPGYISDDAQMLKDRTATARKQAAALLLEKFSDGIEFLLTPRASSESAMNKLRVIIELAADIASDLWTQQGCVTVKGYYALPKVFSSAFHVSKEYCVHADEIADNQKALDNREIVVYTNPAILVEDFDHDGNMTTRILKKAEAWVGPKAWREAIPADEKSESQAVYVIIEG